MNNKAHIYINKKAHIYMNDEAHIYMNGEAHMCTMNIETIQYTPPVKPVTQCHSVIKSESAYIQPNP